MFQLPMFLEASSVDLADAFPVLRFFFFFLLLLEELDALLLHQVS